MRIVSTSLALLVASGIGCAQQWQAAGPGVRQGFACCYDPVRAVTVVFGGATWSSASSASHRTTWEWDGSGWSLRETALAPPGRQYGAMAYDPVRGVCLLFGGSNAGPLSDTWQWDGVQWTQLAPVHTPPTPPSQEWFLATDWTRSRVVLAPISGSTWEWNGTDWLVAGTGPGPGSGPLAFDDARGKVAAFVGNTHWEWTGAAWNLIGATSVPSRYGHGLAYDSVRQRLCVFGGVVAGNYANDLWEWNGTTWQQGPTAPGLGGRYQHGCVFDARRGRLVVNGGWGSPTMFGDTWEYDGTQWYAAAAAPLPTFSHSLAADPATGRLLLYGIVIAPIGQTFEYVAGQWIRASPSVMPPTMEGGLAFDPVRGRFVYFGGRNSTQPTGGAYDWVQGNWVQQPGPTPPARSGHMMALDTARSRIVVFGGISATQMLDETWEWDGIAWTQIAAPVRPSARRFGGLAFDPSHGQLMLYGGSIGYASLGDTWYWTGTTWTPGAPGPGPRETFAMALDPAAGRIVVHGGSPVTNTCEWDGTSWSQLPTNTLSRYTAMAFDGAHMVLFGGVPIGGNQSDPSASTLRLRRTPATAVAYGSGCAATTAPTLLASDRAFAGNSSFSMTIAGVLPETHTWVAASDVPAAVPYGSCTMLIGTPVGFVYALASRAGVARHGVRIPQSPTLVGVPFYWQGFAYDANGPFAALAWSNGVVTHIGN